jgi:hypothetical protein
MVGIVTTAIGLVLPPVRGVRREEKDLDEWGGVLIK